MNSFGPIMGKLEKIGISGNSDVFSTGGWSSLS